MPSTRRSAKRRPAPIFNSRTKYACLDCRVSFKKTRDQPKNGDCDRRFQCPSCGKWLTYMGLHFKAPRKSDIRQWRKVRRLVELGFQFDIRPNGVAFPRTLAGVSEFMVAVERSVRRSQRRACTAKAKEKWRRQRVTKAE